MLRKNSSPSEKSSGNPPSNPDGTLSPTELEKYLLEKRLDLQKYFVFNLGELEGEFNFKNNEGEEVETKGIKKTSSLTQHLSDLTSSIKGFVFFDKPNDPEWKGKKLNQKIKEGQIYIVFDKKLPENGENWFGAVPITHQNTNETHLIIFALNLLSPKVRVFPTKKESLDFLRKNDPALASKS